MLLPQVLLLLLLVVQEVVWQQHLLQPGGEVTDVSGWLRMRCGPMSLMLAQPDRAMASSNSVEESWHSTTAGMKHVIM